MQLSKKWEGRRGVLLNILARLLPMDKKRVLFYSCLNQYNDNPKYIAEKLHEMAPDLHYVWVTGNLDVTADIPSWFKQVRYNSLRYYYQKGRSKVLVDNADGMAGGNKATKRRLMMLKPGQQNISTGHGFALKRTDTKYREVDKNYQEGLYFTSATLLAMGSTLEKEIHEQITEHKVPSQLTGNAREDVLFDITPARRAALRRKLHLPLDKKILLYAPTWRYNVEWAGIKQLQMLDKEKLRHSFSQQFGGEWCMAIRFHQIARQMLSKSGLPVGDLLDANQFADMMEYLAAVDAVITDYSSTMFDCIIGRIPCFLFTPDWQDYERQCGLYIDLDELPFARVDTAEALYQAVLDFDSPQYQAACQRYLQKIGDVNQGDAAKKTAEIILKMLAS